MKTTLKKTDTHRWGLYTFKADTTLCTVLTRFTIDGPFEKFAIFKDQWTIARTPCTRATQKAIEAAHHAAEPAARARMEAEEASTSA